MEIQVSANEAFGPTNPPPTVQREAKVTTVVTPKAKKVENVIGTAIELFKGWKVEGNALVFPADRGDYKAFELAAKAAIRCGRSEDKSFKNTRPGPFWLSRIGNIEYVPPNLTVVTNGGVVQVGQYMRIPDIGYVITHDQFVAICKTTAKITAGSYCGMGVKGTVLGAAAPLGSQFTAWTDFLWFYYMTRTSGKYVYHVDTSCENTMNLFKAGEVEKTDITVVNMKVAVCPEDGKTHVVYYACVGSDGIRDLKPRWVPFIRDYRAGKYFCGTSGLYAIGSVVNEKLSVTPHQRHWINYSGMILFAHNKFKVQVSEPAVEALRKAMTRKEKKGTALLTEQGYDSLGFVKAPTGEGEIQKENKASWVYDCGLHCGDEWKRRKPFPLPDAGALRGTPEAPVMIAHRRVNVISAYTTPMTWSDCPNGGYAWVSTCLSCKTWKYIDPDEFKERSLRPPIVVKPHESSNAPIDAPAMDEGEDDVVEEKKKEKAPVMDEDGEGENAAVPPNSTSLVVVSQSHASALPAARSDVSSSTERHTSVALSSSSSSSSVAGTTSSALTLGQLPKGWKNQFSLPALDMKWKDLKAKLNIHFYESNIVSEVAGEFGRFHFKGAYGYYMVLSCGEGIYKYQPPTFNLSEDIVRECFEDHSPLLTMTADKKNKASKFYIGKFQVSQLYVVAFYGYGIPFMVIKKNPTAKEVYIWFGGIVVHTDFLHAINLFQMAVVAISAVHSQVPL